MHQQFEIIKRTFHNRKGQADMLKQTLTSAQEQSVSLQGQLSVEVEVLKLLQAVSASTWHNTKTVVESIVSRALQAIFFDKHYQFVLTQEVKRDVPTVTFSILDDGMELDVVEEVGGGISDVVALVLRIAFLVLYRPKVRQFLVLDEPGKHVSVVYQAYVGRFLHEICKELDLTILVVTHSKEMATNADQIFKIEKPGKVCKVTSV